MTRLGGKATHQSVRVWCYTHVSMSPSIGPATRILSDVSTFCAYLCPANYPFGGFRAINPLMQNWWDSQTERKTDLAPAWRKDPVTHPRCKSAPTQLEAVTGDWPRGSDHWAGSLSENPTNSASGGKLRQLPSDRPAVASLAH